MVLGGQGRYGAAATVLSALLADPRVPAGEAAHAAVTLGAHRRQLGGHAAARHYDALGLRLASAAVAAGPTPPDDDGTDPRAARVDAMVGLAADAVGTGALDAAARLLDVAALGARAHPSWRIAVRVGWVNAELALVRGVPADAVAPAELAMAAAAGSGSVRHVLKSRIVLAVARAAADAGAVAAAVVELDAAAAEADRIGLLPLSWPARLAAADLTDRPATSAAQPSTTRSDANDTATWASRESVSDTLGDAARRRHAAAATLSVIVRRSDPVGRRLMGESMGLLAPLPVR